jgi:hypothetical protein
MDRHLTQRVAIDPPYGVITLDKFGIHPGDELSIDGASPSNHRMHVMGSRGSGRRQIDLHAQTGFLCVEDEGSDVPADIEDQRLGRSDRWPLVHVPRLDRDMGVVIMVLSYSRLHRLASYSSGSVL